MASIIYNSCVKDLLTGDIDFDTHTFKALLVGTTYDAIADETKKDSHAFRSDVTNEITGTGYTAGGNTCTATVGAIDTTNNRVEVTFSVTNWTSATITNAYGLVIYRNVGSPATTLARTSVISSSNSGAAVTFSAGTKDVFVTQPADQLTPANLIPGGRLSLSSTLAVPTSDLSAQGTLYYLPYTDSKIEIYTGNRWVGFDIGSGISLSLTGLSTATNYDVFAIASSGSPALSTTAWTNATTRATALATVDGVYVQSGTTTRRYLGTIRTSAASQCSDTTAQRFVWNYYNQQRRPIYKVDGGVTSYTYALTTYQQARAQTSNKVEIVCGVMGSYFDLTCHSHTTHATAGQGGITAIGYDAVDFIAPAYGWTIAGFSISQAANQSATAVGRLAGYSGIGFRTLYWIERIFSTGTTTFFNGTDRAGIQGWWEC